MSDRGARPQTATRSTRVDDTGAMAEASHCQRPTCQRPPPNGSRLSCGRSCAGATNAERERMQVGDQHSDSPRTINARQLQALVRLTLPRSHRHGLIFRGAAQGGHRRRAARAPVRPGRHLPCGNLAGPSPRLRLAPRHRAPAEPGPAPNVIDDRHPQTNRIGIDLDGSA